MRTTLAYLLLALSTLHAAISPDHIRRLQEEAAEALVIKADQVDVKITEVKDGRRIDIQVTASIQSVIRSKAGHKPGDVVKVAYKVMDLTNPPPGPDEAKVLAKGETVRAYLDHASDKQSLRLAVYGHSFQKP
ncbi:MAG: hypothetical protein CAK89_02890 [Opitutia bacterium AMD-G3]|nr:MAG: hypothetical protein CAK89_02890 [Opitutae bacterium AMD-G3]